MRTPAAAVLLLALVAPLAAGQSTVSFGGTTNFERVFAAGEGSVFTNVEWDVGRYWWSNGSFQPLATLRPSMAQPPDDNSTSRISFSFARGPDYAASPDGRWLLLENWTIHDEPFRRTDVNTTALDVATGERHHLGELRIAPGASNATHFVLWDEVPATFVLVPWGGWDAAETLTHDALRDAAPHRMALSPHAPHLALVGNGSSSEWVRVLDLESGVWLRGHLLERPVGSIVGAAFSPDGARLAVLTTHGERFAELYVMDVQDDFATLLVERFVETARGLSWTDEGIVVVFADDAGQAGSPRDGVVRLFENPENLTHHRETRLELWPFTGGIAWSEGRLVAATIRGVAIYDAQLRPVLTGWLGRAPTYPPPPAAVDEPPPAEPANVTTSAPASSPSAPGRLVPGAGAAWVSLALIAALTRCRHRPRA